MREHEKINFLNSATEWICDGYSVTIQFILIRDAQEAPWLAGATILANPLPHRIDESFYLRHRNITAGQIQLDGGSRDEVLRIIDSAAHGRIEIKGEQLSLNVRSTLDYYSEMSLGDRDFSDLHLQILGSSSTAISTVDYIAIDNQLRRGTPHFDGLADLANWLTLPRPENTHAQPYIKIRVNPPVDLVSSRCTLRQDVMTVVLRAHAHVEVDQVGLSFRPVPGGGLQGRRQVASLIKWSPTEEDQLEGTLIIEAKEADNALLILMLGTQIVRRHWFIDVSRARNSRLVATQLFDGELRRLQKVLFESTDSREFEKGVASLAFLLGCAPALQVESQAPDLLLSTPGGRIVLVECTQKLADFATKIGKLVDRRRALVKAFESTEQHSDVYAILVCGLPRDQILHNPSSLHAQKITLVAREELTSAFANLRHPIDADKRFEDLDARFAADRSIEIPFP